jgi:hypothetical protein
MPASAVLLAKRAFVKLLVRLAHAYTVVISINRDASDLKVLAAFRKVVIKVHPDKGGAEEDAKALHSAKEVWDKARSPAGRNQGGRPREDHNQGGRRAPRSVPEKLGLDMSNPEEARKQYRIQSVFVLLTYHKIVDVAQWRRFTEFVVQNKRQWSWKHWCATLETTKKGKLHVHLALQFTKQVDRCSRFFGFEGSYPRADLEDFLGEGLNRKRMQVSINRCMFYCFADKVGTVSDEEGNVCTTGNYFPCWVKDASFTYPVPGRWPESLWKAHKLSHETFDQYLFKCRDGVVSRKRNLQAVLERDEEDEEDKERETVTKRVRATLKFQVVPEVVTWLDSFKAEEGRYSFLLLLGPSRSGKTEFAKSLFKNPLELKVGKLEQFPDGLRRFKRNVHDGLVLDDVRDLTFLVENQEKLQSKYDAKLEFGTTPSGQHAFFKWLWRVPLVVTANYTTKSRELLQTDDFLANTDNRTVVERDSFRN